MKIIMFLILALVPAASYADQLVGKVIKITDGDTVNVLTNDNHTHKIRLSGIDAPEKKQAFGNRSKQALAELIDGKTVSVEFNKLDRYKRVVGKITFNGLDVNLRQIKLGLAWHYKKYEKEQDVEDRSMYANAEYQAQRGKVGLWYDSNPTAPWEYRKQKREAN
jgi:endonuclease YncB( thermonuclease family)